MSSILTSSIILRDGKGAASAMRDSSGGDHGQSRGFVPADRLAREGEALRANLRRRKEQARKRAVCSSDTASEDADLPEVGEPG